MLIAKYSSQKGFWGALLESNPFGYNLREYKRNNLVGNAFRPLAMFKNASEAQAWADKHVANCFDVKMKRVFGVDNTTQNV